MQTNINSIELLEHTIRLIFETPQVLSINTPLGIANYAEYTICLNATLHHDAACHTLLHEVIHMIENITGNQFEEQEVDALALGMLSFIRNNKNLIQELTKKEDKVKI